MPCRDTAMLPLLFERLFSPIFSMMIREFVYYLHFFRFMPRFRHAATRYLIFSRWPDDAAVLYAHAQICRCFSLKDVLLGDYAILLPPRGACRFFFFFFAARRCLLRLCCHFFHMNLRLSYSRQHGYTTPPLPPLPPLRLLPSSEFSPPDLPYYYLCPPLLFSD